MLWLLVLRCCQAFEKVVQGGWQRRPLFQMGEVRPPRWIVEWQDQCEAVRLLRVRLDSCSWQRPLQVRANDRSPISG